MIEILGIYYDPGTDQIFFVIRDPDEGQIVRAMPVVDFMLLLNMPVIPATRHAGVN